MAKTALQIVNKVRRKVGLSQVTAFAETDESNDNLADINEAYRILFDALPDDLPYTMDTTSGDFSTVASTRTYALDSSAKSFNLLEWSVNNETENDAPLRMITLQALQDLDKQYDEKTGQPTHVYLDGTDQIALYPIPDAVYNIKYKFKTAIVEARVTTDTFLLPDEWIEKFVVKKASALYLGPSRKGFMRQEEVELAGEQELAEIIGQAAEMHPSYLVGDRYY